MLPSRVDETPKEADYLDLFQSVFRQAFNIERALVALGDDL